MPVVLVLALAPLLLEGGLTLRDGQLVVEIPFAALLLVGLIGSGRLVAVAHTTIFGLGLLRHFLKLGLALFFLFFLEGLDHTVDGFIAVFLRHVGQGEEGVLQMNGIGIGCQFVEDF